MEMVTIKTFDNYFTANIILTKLREAGIQCYLADETTATLYPVLLNAIGGIKLTVESNDVAEACELLEKFEEEYLLSVKCPKCGENSIEIISRASPRNFITSILTWLFSSYAVAPEKIYQCKNCKYESKTLPETQIEITDEEVGAFSDN